MKVTTLTIIFSLLIISTIGQGIKDIEIIPNIVYHQKDGNALTMDLYIPSNSNGKGVVFINSGGFQSPFFSKQYKERIESLPDTVKNRYILIPKSDIKPEYSQQFSFEELIKNGYTVFDVRHGSAPKYKLDEIISDLNLAISYIKGNTKKFKISNNRIGICGGSAGGYLAAFLASHPETGNSFKAAVLYYPAGYDYRHSRNDEVRKALPSLNISEHKLDSLSLKHYLSDQMPPTLIMYGENDNPFITEPSEIIINELKNKGVICDKIIFDHIGHIWMDEKGEYSRETGTKAMIKLVDWFNTYL